MSSTWGLNWSKVPSVAQVRPSRAVYDHETNSIWSHWAPYERSTSTVEIDRWLHTGAEDLAESEPQPHFQHMFFGPRRSEVANHNVPDHTHPTPSSEFSLLYFD